MSIYRVQERAIPNAAGIACRESIGACSVTVDYVIPRISGIRWIIDSELSVIKGIEGFQPELQRPPFAEFYALV